MSIESAASRSPRLTNYAAYMPEGSRKPRIGHLDLKTNEITPLSYASGTAIRSLYEVIEAGDEAFVQDGKPFPRHNARMLPPIYGRDILAVGKNYAVSQSILVPQKLSLILSPGACQRVQCFRASGRPPLVLQRFHRLTKKQLRFVR